MNREDGRTSQEFREESKMFKRLDNGKFGGYKKGISNGPAPRRPARKSK